MHCRLPARRRGLYISCGAALGHDPRDAGRPDTATVLSLASQAGLGLAADKTRHDELRRWMGDGRVVSTPSWALPEEPRSVPSPVRVGGPTGTEAPP